MSVAVLFSSCRGDTLYHQAARATALRLKNSSLRSRTFVYLEKRADAQELFVRLTECSQKRLWCAAALFFGEMRDVRDNPALDPALAALLSHSIVVIQGGSFDARISPRAVIFYRGGLVTVQQNFLQRLRTRGAVKFNRTINKVVRQPGISLFNGRSAERVVAETREQWIPVLKDRDIDCRLRLGAQLNYSRLIVNGVGRATLPLSMHVLK